MIRAHLDRLPQGSREMECLMEDNHVIFPPPHSHNFLKDAGESARAGGTPIGPPAAAPGYWCGVCDDCPLDPEWLAKHVAVHHAKARTPRAA